MGFKWGHRVLYWGIPTILILKSCGGWTWKYCGTSSAIYIFYYIVKLQEQAPIWPVQTGKYFNSEKPLLISFLPTFNHTKCGYLVGMWVSEGPKMALSWQTENPICFKVFRWLCHGEVDQYLSNPVCFWAWLDILKVV